MTKENNNGNQDVDLSEETMSFNDNCATPVIAQIDSPADLNIGIVELSEDEQKQEP